MAGIMERTAESRADSSAGRAVSLYLTGRGFESLSAHKTSLVEIIANCYPIV